MPFSQNDFKAFATGGGAFVLSQAAYEALATLSTGFNSGTAVKEQLNKVWRQSSFAAAVLMQYIGETLDSDSLDDGDLGAHVDRLREALSFGSTNPVGSSMVRGLLALNTAAFLTTKMDITASRVQFVDAAGKILVRDIGATYTCDTGAGGPAVNSRDQAGAFGANNWLYFYFILNPTTDTVASIVSLTPPETFDGTTLPAGYTSWAFALSTRFNGASQLVRVAGRGNEVFYAAYSRALNNGAATVATPVSLASFVPPHAEDVELVLRAGAGNDGTSLQLQIVSGVDLFSFDDFNGSPGPLWGITVPNVGQQIFYDWDVVFSGGSVDIDVASYTIPNGG